MLKGGNYTNLRFAQDLFHLWRLYEMNLKKYVDSSLSGRNISKQGFSSTLKKLAGKVPLFFFVSMREECEKNIIISSESFHTVPAPWITLNHLFNFDCSIIIINNPIITPKEWNIFIRHWKSYYSNPTLKRLIFQYQSLNDVHVIMNLPHHEIDPMEFEITRVDGTKAICGFYTGGGNQLFRMQTIRSPNLFNCIYVLYCLPVILFLCFKYKKKCFQ